MQQSTPSLFDLDAQSLFEHTRWMRHLAQRLVSGGEQPDDLVQEAWTVATKNPPAQGVPLKAWLAGIMRRVALNDRRTGGNRSSREKTVAMEAAAAGAPSTDALVALAEEKRLLIDGILGLPDRQREVILLRYYEGLPAREIAARLDVSVKVVHAQRERGLQTLREELDGRHGGDRRAWGLAFLPLAHESTPAQAALSSAGVGLSSFILLKAFVAIAALVVIGLGARAILAKGETAAGPEETLELAQVPKEAAHAPTALVGVPSVGAEDPGRRAAALGAPNSVVARAATISGTITDSVSGAALGGGYVTIAAATVQTVMEVEPDGSFRDELTDADAAESFFVTASYGGYITSTLPATPNEPLAIALLPCGRLAGTVFDDAGVPRPGSHLLLLSDALEDSAGNRLTDAVRERLTADERGRFTFPDLLPGAYALCVLEDPGNPDEDALVRRTVRIEAAKRSEVNVLMDDPDAVNLSGLLTPAEPVEFALVPAFFPYAERGSMVMGQPAAGYKKGAGAFTAKGLQRGRYLVLLMPAVDDHAGPFAFIPNFEVELSSPTDVARDFEFPPHRITGHIASPAGVSSLVVAAVPVVPSGLAKSFSEGDKVRELFGAPVGEDGSFTLPHIATGPYRIDVFRRNASAAIASQIVEVQGDVTLPPWKLE